MLEIRNISKSYGDKCVLENISVKVKNGTITSLLGKNGSGKTTTLRLIAGLLSLNKGEILLNEETINLKDIGYLTEERSLYNDCTVYEQLELICRINKIENIEQAIEKQLFCFSLNKYKDTLIGRLSKGNKQKVALATVLIKDPQLIMLDEPFTGLDEQNISLFIRILLSQKEKGKIIILSSHLYQIVNEICDYYLVIRDGKIIVKISQEEIMKDNRFVVETNNELIGYDKNFIKGNKNIYVYSNYDDAQKSLKKHPKEEYTIRKLGIKEYLLDEGIDNL